MSLMAQPWKHPSTGVYYFRRVVPKDLQKSLGKTEWKVSLHSKDLATIRPRFTAEASRCEEAFKAARDQLKGIPVVLPSDAPKIADRWTKGVLAEWEKDPSKVSSFLATVPADSEGEDSDRVPTGDVLDLDDPRVRITITDSLVIEALRKERLPLPPLGSPARVALENALLPRWVALCRIAFDRHTGEWHTSLPLPDADKPLSSEPVKADTQSSSAPLSEAYSQWATAKRAESARVF